MLIDREWFAIKDIGKSEGWGGGGGGGGRDEGRRQTHRQADIVTDKQKHKAGVEGQGGRGSEKPVDLQAVAKDMHREIARGRRTD